MLFVSLYIHPLQCQIKRIKTQNNYYIDETRQVIKVMILVQRRVIIRVF